MDLLSPTLKAILERLNDGVYFVDPQRNIQYWNAAAERITGYKAGQVVGEFCTANILMHVNDTGEQLCKGLCPLSHTLKDGLPREGQVYLHHADGHRVSVSVRVIPVRAASAAMEEGQITGAVEIFSESTSLATALTRIKELQREVNLDALTGVGNRRMIESRLQAGLKEWENQNQPFGVLMIDIDYFKRVNDTYGHDTGDQVLKMVSASLSNGLRSYDYIGRWGGEEFLVLAAGVDEETLRTIAERLRMLVERSVIFLDHNNRQRDQSAAVRVTVSIGGALMQPGETLEGIIQNADRNLYACKAAGRNRVIVS